MRVFPMFHLAATPHRWGLALALAAALLAGAAHAQSAEDGSAADPPDRVARLSYLAGDVGFLPDGGRDWQDASVNRPLTRGDRLTAAHGARAELELDRASLRLDGDTDAGILQLDDRLAQLELTRGTLNLSVRALDPGERVEIDTPNVALVVDAPGVFRVDVDDRSGTTGITAFNGQGTVYGDSGASRQLVGGHAYRFDDSALAQVGESYAGARDAFDLWCADRDERYARADSGAYASDEMIGYEDLDGYGDWQSDDDYGAVWYPAYVAADWAPYRDGHWAFIAPWGWTWVDDAPWGFAPYHYGRWVHLRNRWGWIPGPRGLRPVYAPALVAFLGGHGWSVSVGAGAPIGWFPLGPGDFYDPWYRVSAAYYRRVNQHNMRWDRHDRDRGHGYDDHFRRYREGRGPENRYANRGVPHAVTAVPRDAFAQARRVQAHQVRLDPARLHQAPVLTRGADLPAARTWTRDHPRFPARRAPVPDSGRTVVRHYTPDPAHASASLPQRFPQARAERADAPPVRGLAGPASAQFAPHGDRDRAAMPPPRGNGMLPAVPRLVRAGQAPAMPREAPRHASLRAVESPRTLPVPPRIVPADRADRAAAWHDDDRSALVHAPAMRRDAAPPRRFEPRDDRGFERPAMPAPRAAVPRQPQRTEPPPRPAYRAVSRPAPPPARAGGHDNRSGQAAAGFHHR